MTSNRSHAHDDNTTRRRARIVRLLVPVYFVMIFGSAGATATLPLVLASTLVTRGAALAAAPLLFGVVLLVVAGTLSMATRGSIVPGRYPRSLGHAVYGPRRLYALCWTCVYYCSPVYHAMLAMPLLKRLTWRLFGYRGALNFTIYPDAWVRDLPLLDIGEGAYISNKATVSPNMCLRDGTIVILPVQIGARSLIGHLTMIAPGVTIGEDTEVGVGAAIGLRAQVGSESVVGHCAVVDHGVRLGTKCRVGVRAYVGRGTVVADRLRIPDGATIPPRMVLRTQDDVDRVCGSTPRLRRVRSVGRIVQSMQATDDRGDEVPSLPPADSRI